MSDNLRFYLVKFLSLINLPILILIYMKFVCAHLIFLNNFDCLNPKEWNDAYKMLDSSFINIHNLFFYFKELSILALHEMVLCISKFFNKSFQSLRICRRSHASWLISFYINLITKIQNHPEYEQKTNNSQEFFKNYIQTSVPLYKLINTIQTQNSLIIKQPSI